MHRNDEFDDEWPSPERGLVRKMVVPYFVAAFIQAAYMFSPLLSAADAPFFLFLIPVLLFFPFFPIAALVGLFVPIFFDGPSVPGPISGLFVFLVVFAIVFAWHNVGE